MMIIALTMLFGALVFFGFSSIPSINFIIIFIAIAGIMAVFAWYKFRVIKINLKKAIKGNKVVNMFLLSILGFLFGFILAFNYSSDFLNNVLRSELEKKPITVIGAINSLPDISQRKTSYGVSEYAKFEFSVISAKYKKQAVDNFPKKIAIKWYNSSKNLKPGQLWQFKLSLKRVHGNANPGVYDYEKWAFENGIGATGYVKKWSGNKLLEDTNSYSIDNIRYNLKQKLKGKYKKSKSVDIILALLIGDRSGFSSNHWEVFTKTGTSHLVAISGLHVGLIAGLAYLLISYLWGGFYFLSDRVAPIYVASLGAIVAAIMYSALAGFAVPTQRALIMIVVVMLSKLLKRNTTSLRSLSIAAIFIVVINPVAVISASFWLSFAAVWIILKVINNKSKNESIFLKWIKIQLYINLALLPFVFYFFGKVSLISPVVNLICVPLFSFVVIPFLFIAVILLLIFPLVGNYIFILFLKLMELIWVALEKTASLEFSQVSFSLNSFYEFILAVVIVVFLLAETGSGGNKKYKYQSFAVILLFILSISHIFSGAYIRSQTYPGQGEFKVSYLDVGQGLSVLVTTKNHALLYDAGPKWSGGAGMGEKVVVPVLRSKKISNIDKMVISHGDNDHAGGAEFIFKNLNVLHVLSGEPQKLPFADAFPCNSQDSNWIWDDVKFEVLYPQMQKQRQKSKGKKYKGNDSSCVLKISSGEKSILLTGDITKKVERKLIKVYGDGLKSDILLAPHHGSKSSSSLAFIKAVKPDYVIYSSGYLNRYRFPAKKVVSNYKKMKVKQLNTAYGGMIEFGVSQEGIALQNIYRKDNKSLWTDPYREVLQEKGGLTIDKSE